MFCSLNLLSEYTQRALLVLNVLSREYRSKGQGVLKKELIEITGLPARALRHYVANLASRGWVGCEKRRLVPGRKLNEATLYDLIACMDGWVHIGNACIDNVIADPFFGFHIRRCEADIRSGLDDYLRSIPLSYLMSACEGKPEPTAMFKGRPACGAAGWQ